MQYLHSSIYQCQTLWTAIRKDTKEGERPVRCAFHSSHQFFGEVTNQITNFKSPVFLFQVTQMCCIIQLQLRVRNIYCN